MNHLKEVSTEEQRDAACKGELCLHCYKKNVECTGCAPDGFRMNYAYKCCECGNQWEGY